MQIKNPFSDYEILIYDIEVYPNFFVAVFYDGNQFFHFNLRMIDPLRCYLEDQRKVLVGYNSIEFDDLVLKAILSGKVKTEKDIYELVQKLFAREDRKLINRLKYRLPQIWGRSVDLMALGFKDEESGSGKASLKEIAIRLHWQKIQDLPYNPNTVLSVKEMEETVRYCENDVLITASLWNEMHREVVLRKALEDRYGVKVFSHSNAKISEDIFLNLYSRRTHIDKRTLKRYNNREEVISVVDIIPNWVEFTTPVLSQLLSRIKSHRIEKRDDRWEYGDLWQTVEFDGIEYGLGVGGIHSKDSAGMFESTDERKIIDVDVTSYYPSIIINNNRYPSHLTAEWTNILRELTEQRIAAKKEGDKITADSLKIVINSAFGKSGNPYSFMYDQSFLLFVTITGQLAILMLIESLVLSGFEVLSANTDGVTLFVEDDRYDTFISVCRKWQKTTQFNLEETVYASYIRKDVNNYIAITSDSVKTKGEFRVGSLYKKNDADILKIALKKYFVDGVDVEETIRGETNLHHFCYSYKATRSFQPMMNGVALQRTNRWYCATEGGRLEKKRIKATTTNSVLGQRTKITNGERVVLANDLNGKFPDNIDYDHYIHQAKRIIHKTKAGKVAKEIKAMGLAPIPKEAKKNPRGARLSEVKEDWDFGAYAGVGCYTGDFVGIIALDLDQPEMVKIYDNVVDTLTVWHGPGTRYEVQKGEKIGTLLYRCHNGMLKTSGGKFKKKHGFEILYGKKTVQMFGLHTNGEEYIYDGELADLPQELELWLLENSPRKRPKKNKSVDPDTGDLFDDPEPGIDSEAFYGEEDCEKLRTLIEELLPEWKYELVEDDGYKFRGYCPHSDDHTRKSNFTDFDIYLRQGWQVPSVKCHHSSCETSVRQLEAKFRSAWTETQRIKKRSDIKNLPVPAEKDNTIASALRSDTRHYIIEAPTGAGKTHESALFFLKCIKNEEPVTYVASNKSELAQFAELVETLSSKSLAELYTQLLQSGENVNEEKDEDGGVVIAKSTLGIITHHTYLKRKGISDVFFTFLYWIKQKNPVVIVDEAANFLKSLNTQIEIGGRYKARKNKGAKKATFHKVSVCPAFSKSGNCQNCFYKQYQEYEVNRYNIPVISEYEKISEDDFQKSKKLDLPKLQLEDPRQVGKIQIQPIQQNNCHLKDKEYKFHLKDKEYYHLSEAIRDMIDTAHHPAVYKVFPVWKDTKQPILNPREEITAENKKNVEWPYQACGVPILSLLDCSTVEWLRRHAKKTRWFCAMLGPTNREFLESILPDAKSENIMHSQQQIDSLSIITFQDRLHIVEQKKKVKVPFFKDMDRYGKVLVFEPRKQNAETVFKKIPDKYACGMYVENSIALLREKFAEGKWHALIAYSHGPLGRGMNLPEFYTNLISGLVYKPAIAFPLDRYTQDELEARILEDRLEMVYQNAGRIIRGNTGRKLILIHNANIKDAEFLKQKLAPMVREEIVTKHFTYDKLTLKQCAFKWLALGEIVDEKSIIEKSREESEAYGGTVLSKMSPVRRKEIDEVQRERLKKMRKKEHQAKRMEKLRHAARIFDGSWREFSIDKNIHRLKKSGKLTEEQVEELIKIVEN